MFNTIQLYKIDFKGKCCDLFQFEIPRCEEKAAMRREQLTALFRRVSKSRNWKIFVICICGDALVFLKLRYSLFFQPLTISVIKCMGWPEHIIITY